MKAVTERMAMVGILAVCERIANRAQAICAREHIQRKYTSTPGHFNCIYKWDSVLGQSKLNKCVCDRVLYEGDTH